MLIFISLQIAAHITTTITLHSVARPVGVREAHAALSGVAAALQQDWILLIEI